LFWRHNSFVKRVDRIKKYRARGIDIDSTVHLPSSCPALRELVVCPESWRDSPPEIAEQLQRFPLKSPFFYSIVLQPDSRGRVQTTMAILRRRAWQFSKSMK
jgi:hypothetical protein